MSAALQRERPAKTVDNPACSGVHKKGRLAGTPCGKTLVGRFKTPFSWKCPRCGTWNGVQYAGG
jgi:hypothetical protein